jgi:multiple sugar transport system permease protein
VSPATATRRTPARSGLIPLRVAALALLALAVGVSWWTWRATRGVSGDGRETIVFWGSTSLGEDRYTLIHRFEQQNPRYRVELGSAVARDLTGDAQRLLTAIVGGVPPDLVWFDRFAVGEWASKQALEDLTPWLERQDPHDALRIDLSQYYPFALDEGSYRPPGATSPKRVYGVPVSADIRLLYTNLDLLRQEGLVDAQGKPRPPATWEELRDYNKRLSRFRTPGDPASGMTRLGFAPSYGNSWLYIYAFQAGGAFLSSDGTRCTLDSPEVVRALRFMTDLYDDIGGVAQANAFQQGFQSGPLDPFFKGQVAMKIDGSWCLDGFAAYAPDMDFAVTPAPIPADRLAAGEQPITWAGGWALVMPATARHKEGAFKLMQFLRSWESVKLIEDGKRELAQSQGQLYIPGIQANRAHYEQLVAERVEADPRFPPRFKHAIAAFRELLGHTLIRPVTPVGQLLWNQHAAATDAAVTHQYAAQAKVAGVDEVAYTLRLCQAPVQRQLDAIIQPPPPHVVSWRPYLALYALAVGALLAAILIAARRRRIGGYRPRETAAALMFASPWLLGFVVFTGGPILVSIVYSFTRYDVLTDARYVGFDNYREMLGDPLFYQSLGNTAFMLVRVPLVMAVGLAIALLLNRGLRGLPFYRTAFYLPVVMPMVAASVLWMWVFNPSQGFLNQGLHWLFDTMPGHAVERVASLFTDKPVHLDAPLWLQDKHWTKPALIVMNLWTAGGSMIIWLAGLQGIPKQLYEAASIDGANAWQRFRHITVPLLTPYIFFNLIVGVIGTMQIFSEAYIMNQNSGSAGPGNSLLFYAYYLFIESFQYFRIGYASALAWILFLIVLALTLVQLWLSKRWVHYDQT